LDVVNQVKSEELEGRVEYVTRAIIDWSETSKATVEAEGALKFFGLNLDTATNVTYEKAKEADLELIYLAIDEGKLTWMLNHGADGARHFLAEGNDGRICGGAFVVVSAELGEHFDTYASKSLSVRAAGTGLSITVTGGKQGSQTITYTKGATFAYKLFKVKDWNKDKTRIEEMEPDYKGMG
jgi:hypothetical protein